jgi:hypothetical protein
MKRIEEENRRVMEEQEEERRKAREKAAEVKTILMLFCSCDRDGAVTQEFAMEDITMISQLPIAVVL